MTVSIWERKFILRAIVNAVVAPHVVWPLWSEPNARSVVQPQPTALRLFLWNLQPLTAPQLFHALIIDLPTRVTLWTQHDFGGSGTSRKDVGKGLLTITKRTDFGPIKRPKPA